jgi:hypothetical protein
MKKNAVYNDMVDGGVEEKQTTDFLPRGSQSQIIRLTRQVQVDRWPDEATWNVASQRCYCFGVLVYTLAPLRRTRMYSGRSDNLASRLRRVDVAIYIASGD